MQVRGKGLAYVSRGGLKLEKAMGEFPIALDGKVCMDVGASTGGFTDCMLQNGARKVYAVDVGYGQLAWTLRNDPRVVILERTNARYLTREQIPRPSSFSPWMFPLSPWGSSSRRCALFWRRAPVRVSHQASV